MTTASRPQHSQALESCAVIAANKRPRTRSQFNARMIAPNERRVSRSSGAAPERFPISPAQASSRI